MEKSYFSNRIVVEGVVSLTSSKKLIIQDIVSIFIEGNSNSKNIYNFYYNVNSIHFNDEHFWMINIGETNLDTFETKNIKDFLNDGNGILAHWDEFNICFITDNEVTKKAIEKFCQNLKSITVNDTGLFIEGRD